jgi:hypothetical protein
MSTFTLGEITLWLVLVACAGFALGWVVRELQVRATRSASTPVPMVEPVPEVEPQTLPEPEPEPEPKPLIKGKTSSMIYHPPASSSYARVKADVWFHTEQEAEAAGYRKPKNM